MELNLLHATVGDVYAIWRVHADCGAKLPHLFQGRHPEQP